ncbi:MAG: hypothetical protein HDQ96_04005 [Lachnospiraceae bacterium]|nr:hypothetical protein [Lachnospiraceae bacterium]
MDGTWLGTILLVLVVCLIIVLFWVMIWDSNRFVINKYTFSSKKLKKDCRIVFLSDLHNKEYGIGNQSLLQAIDDISPDLVLVGGDMLRAKPGVSFKKGASFVLACGKKYPVYYAMGNHEYRARIYPEKYDTMYMDYMESFQGSGIRFLDNESSLLAEFGIRLTGLTLDKKYYKRLARKKLKEGYLQESIGEADKSSFQIMLAHNPEFFPDYAAWKPDLVLSGHTHGGVARIPGSKGIISPALQLFPHYDGGLFEEFGSRMVISRGLGMHTIPVRLFNPGELVVLELQRSEKA